MPKSWKLDWVGKPWISYGQNLLTASSKPFDFGRCPKIPPGQVGIALSEDAPIPGQHFDTSGFSPRPDSFVLGKPKSLTFTKSCNEPQDVFLLFTDAGRYLYAHVLFGSGAYATQRVTAEAVLNSLVVSKPRALVDCKAGQIGIEPQHVLIRNIYDETNLYFSNKGPTCFLGGKARLSVNTLGGSPIRLPKNPNSSNIQVIIQHSKKVLVGWWYFWNWCGSTSPVSYSITTDWGATSFTSAPLAPCDHKVGPPSLEWTANHSQSFIGG